MLHTDDVGITLLRLGIAAGLGGVIGFQRAYLGKPAGVRTHLLICTGSALFCLVSFTAFQLNSDTPQPQLIAQTVSGVSFLGTGLILRGGLTVKGLTSAASIWVTMGIGLAAGTGQYRLAAIGTLFILLGLLFLRPLDNIRAPLKLHTIDIHLPAQVPLPEIVSLLCRNRIEILNIRCTRLENELVVELRILVPKNESLPAVTDRLLPLGVTRVVWDKFISQGEA